MEGSNTIGQSNEFWVGFLLLVAIALVYPMFRSTFFINNVSFLLTFTFLGLSLSIVWGYADIFSFGQVAFFGLAGYTFGVVGINITGPEGTILAFFISVAIAAVFAFALGYFMFYGGVSNVYVAILTLVVTLVLYTFMGQTAGSQWAIGEARLGGANGMTGIPTLELGFGESGLELDGIVLYYFTIGLLIATYLGLRYLLNSDYGYVMVAVRENTERTEMLGYNVNLIKVQVFTLGGALAGAGGVLYASWSNFISPSVFSLTFAVLPIIWVATGGRTSIIGAILGTYTIEFLNQQLALQGSQYALVVLGAILLFVILYLPDGVVPRLHEKYPEWKETVQNRRQSSTMGDTE